MNAAPARIEVRLNDEPRVLPPSATLLAVLRDANLAERRGVAVAINGEVVPRSTWAERSLRDGERILVIQATQGG